VLGRQVRTLVRTSLSLRLNRHQDQGMGRFL